MTALESLVLALIRNNPGITKKEIIYFSGYSNVAIRKSIKVLLHDGRIKKSVKRFKVHYDVKNTLNEIECKQVLHSISKKE